MLPTEFAIRHALRLALMGAAFLALSLDSAHAAGAAAGTGGLLGVPVVRASAGDTRPVPFLPIVTRTTAGKSGGAAGGATRAVPHPGRMLAVLSAQLRQHSAPWRKGESFEILVPGAAGARYALYLGSSPEHPVALLSAGIVPPHGVARISVPLSDWARYLDEVYLVLVSG